MSEMFLFSLVVLCLPLSSNSQSLISKYYLTLKVIVDFQEEDKEASLSGFDYFFHLVAGAVECTYW